MERAGGAVLAVAALAGWIWLVNYVAQWIYPTRGDASYNQRKLYRLTVIGVHVVALAVVYGAVTGRNPVPWCIFSGGCGPR